MVAKDEKEQNAVEVAEWGMPFNLVSYVPRFE